MANAIYVWKGCVEPEDLTRCCRKHDVSIVFLSKYQPLSAKGRVSRLIEASGMRFYAMASTNEFCMQHDGALWYIDDILNFNKDVGEHQRFAGIHFDIEPHTLHDFSKRAELYFRQYAAMLQKCREKTAEAGLDFGVSIPWWYECCKSAAVHENDCCIPLAQKVIELTDHVSIMSYLSNAADAVKMARPIIEKASAAKKRAFLAVDRLELLEQIKETLAQQCAGIEGCEGVAIHHYHKLVGAAVG